MILKLTILLVLSVYKCTAVIYHLNESEHARMPPVFHLAPYEPCVQQGGRYCAVEFRLVADGHSELLDMIREYSAHKRTHYNHSNLEHGICVTQTCSRLQIYNTTVDQRANLEACLNETLWRDYKLKAKVTDISCNVGMFSEQNVIDVVDVLVAIICGSLIVLSVAGSLQEFWTEKRDQGNEWLSCFSVQRNWKALMAGPGDKDPKLKSLQAIYGIRTLTMILVIAIHSLYPFVASAVNTRDYEEKYSTFKYLGNGTLIVQTFFLMSGFLLAYNLQLDREKEVITARMLPRRILLRFLRIAPAFLFILAIRATWMRFAGSGPYWQKMVIGEVADCRRDWWLNVLFLNNYIHTQCMPEAWYLAADIQLTIVGLVTCVMLKGKARMLALALLYTAGMASAAAHTYIQDLDATVVGEPDNGRHFLVHDPTFNNLYKQGHTNSPSYVLGLVLGLLVYHWQKTGFDFRKYPIYRYIFWLVVPAGCAAIGAGSVVYADSDNGRLSIYVRTVWAAVNKNVFGIVTGCIVVGTAFKVDNVYRGILRWRGWVPPALLSYCAYLVNMLLIRWYFGSRTSLLHVTFGNILATNAVAVLASFLAAVPFWLLVEAPIAKVVKIVDRRTRTLPEKALMETFALANGVEKKISYE